MFLNMCANVLLWNGALRRDKTKGDWEHMTRCGSCMCVSVCACACGVCIPVLCVCMCASLFVFRQKNLSEFKKNPSVANMSNMSTEGTVLKF